MNVISIPYCGAPPQPGELLARFNLDPVLITVLIALALLQSLAIRQEGSHRRGHVSLALAGWGMAAVAFLTPICALSVALFSARITQHMVLILIAAPLIALGLPATRASHYVARLWLSAAFFCVALWFWHMPAPYDATFSSTWIYWAMHVTLFGSAICLWRELLDHPPTQTAHALAAAVFTFMHMGLLGAVLALAGRPMFAWHLLTTPAWGLTPLQDQQLGGVIMWVPGVGLFLWVAMRSLSQAWRSIDRARPA